MTWWVAVPALRDRQDAAVDELISARRRLGTAERAAEDFPCKQTHDLVCDRYDEVEDCIALAQEFGVTTGGALK